MQGSERRCRGCALRNDRLMESFDRSSPTPIFRSLQQVQLEQLSTSFETLITQVERNRAVRKLGSEADGDLGCLSLTN